MESGAISVASAESSMGYIPGILLRLRWQTGPSLLRSRVDNEPPAATRREHCSVARASTLTYYSLRLRAPMYDPGIDSVHGAPTSRSRTPLAAERRPRSHPAK